MTLPQHLAVIMDGNGRWAAQRGLPRSQGHEAGVKAAQRLYRHCRHLGIGHLTLYAFSKENWLRPKDEVSFLFGLVTRFFTHREQRELMDLDIRFQVLGELDGVPEATRKVLKESAAKTAGNSSMVLNLALNYSGRDEILRAARLLLQEGLRPEEITPEAFADRLYTTGQPDPDLVVRTSGEFRLSNYLLYQSAYAELYFTETLWPDFDEAELDKALEEFTRRQRRFGRTGEQAQGSGVTGKIKN